MSKNYPTVSGIFRFSRTERMCECCGEKKEIQRGSQVCDDCLVDKLIAGTAINSEVASQIDLTEGMQRALRLHAMGRQDEADGRSVNALRRRELISDKELTKTGWAVFKNLGAN